MGSRIKGALKSCLLFLSLRYVSSKFQPSRSPFYTKYVFSNSKMPSSGSLPLSVHSPTHDALCSASLLWMGRHGLPSRMHLGLCLLGARGGNARLPVVLCAPDLLKKLVSCLVSWLELICSMPCNIISCQVILTRACHLALQIPSSVFHMVARTCWHVWHSEGQDFNLTRLWLVKCPPHGYEFVLSQLLLLYNNANCQD